MIKKIIVLTAILISFNSSLIAMIDTSYTDHLAPFNWNPISDSDKITQYENQKTLTKRSIQQAAKGKEHYDNALNYMQNKEYMSAISEFEIAIKRYERAKLSADGMNYIYLNMALSYTNSGYQKDKAEAERLLSLLTAKIYDEKEWAYNAAIAHYQVGKMNDATKILSKLISKNYAYFQAYVTLEAIYREGENDDQADKVLDRMLSAEEKYYNKKKKSNKNKTQNIVKEVSQENGQKPDITKIIAISNVKLKDYTNSKELDKKKNSQMQSGIENFILGTKSLKDRNYTTAQKELKDAEKVLRKYLSDDGLNYVRGNLAIAYLVTTTPQSKRGVGTANKYLRNITSKLYNKQKWTYNMAVSYYHFAFMSAREDKKNKTRKWNSPKPAENLKTSIKLFQKSISQDKLYLPAYENLIYIYREQGENEKADKLAKSLQKVRLKLVTKYSLKEQEAKGGEKHIFRLNLGTFGRFDTPAYLFDEEHVIAIPLDEIRTVYLSGKFYSVDDVKNYQKVMKNKGYNNTFIVAYKDGEEIGFE